MKKAITLLLVSSLILSACGNEEHKDTKSNEKKTESNKSTKDKKSQDKQSENDKKTEEDSKASNEQATNEEPKQVDNSSNSQSNPYIKHEGQEWRYNTGTGLSSGEMQKKYAVENGTYQGKDAQIILEALKYYERTYGNPDTIKKVEESSQYPYTAEEYNQSVDEYNALTDGEQMNYVQRGVTNKEYNDLQQRINQLRSQMDTSQRGTDAGMLENTPDAYYSNDQLDPETGLPRDGEEPHKVE